MKLGSVLDVQLVDAQGKPLAMSNVSIDVVLYCSGNERYRFDIGTTDTQGHISTSYEALDQTRMKNQAFALMDYNTKLEECDDTVGLAVPTLDQLHERLAAARKWFPKSESMHLDRVKSSKNGSIAVSGVKKITTNGSGMAVQLPVQ